MSRTIFIQYRHNGKFIDLGNQEKQHQIYFWGKVLFCTANYQTFSVMPCPMLGQTALKLRNSFLEVQLSTLSETNDPSLIKSNKAGPKESCSKIGNIDLIWTMPKPAQLPAFLALSKYISTSCKLFEIRPQLEQTQYTRTSGS